MVPFAFAFAILKYKLLDIQVVIRRTLLYGTLTIVLGLVFLGAAGVLAALLSQAVASRETWVPVGSTLLTAIAVVPVRNRVQRVIDRRFFRQKYDYPTALRAVETALSGGDGMEHMAASVAEHVQETLHCRAVAVAVRPPGQRHFAPLATVGLPDEVPEKVRFDAAGSWIKTRSPSGVIYGKDAPAEVQGALSRCRAELIVPIEKKKSVFGLLLVGSKLSDKDFDAEDIDFLKSAAAQIAVALENLQLHEVARESDRAREIQEAFLPRHIPQLPGLDVSGIWRPARAVSGDYYDVFAAGENRLALIIADVSGKGVPAALLMSNLQAAVRMSAPEAVSTAEWAQRINRSICANISPGKFITFFCGLLDVPSRRLQYTNAGHNPPFVIRGDGGRSQLDRGGPILGFFPEAKFDFGEIQLEVGDRLILFTDGVSEAANDADEEFGEERLAELVLANMDLTASELQTLLLDTVTAFCAGNFHDDVTLLVVGYVPQPEAVNNMASR